MHEPSLAKITFRQVKMLAADKLKDEQLSDALDKMLGAILILSPVVFGPAGVPALGLLGAKNELVKIGRGAIRKFIRNDSTSYVARGRNLAAAHCLLTFTAYYDALDEILPEFMARTELTPYDQQEIIKRTAQLSPKNTDDAGNSLLDLSEMSVGLPHPALSRDAERVARKQTYTVMTEQLKKLIVGLAAWDELPGSQQDRVAASLRQLPDSASTAYEAQLAALATDVPQFSAWTGMLEHNRTQQVVTAASELLRADIATVSDAVTEIDMGLVKLSAAIEALPKPSLTAIDADQVASALTRVYTAHLSKRVIDDRHDPSPGEARLTYPTKSDAFVPQAFKVVMYENDRMRLEAENAWVDVGVVEDLGGFIIDYLQSLYSSEAPLLILGQPGSGKSLFTEILAARLRPPQFNAVRVELRDIDADVDIQRQIELQIRKDTGLEVSWPTYSEGFPESPPVVILDGYDELLQSSGKVYAPYLDDIQRFQRREAIQNRPVRVIITSRIALIDRALMPQGTTVLRLLEFDPQRRKLWIEMWNRHNSEYFSRSGVMPFQLGSDSKILQLAQQPLLLLMLAVYDSHENKLRESRTLDQTRLYHSLLCRFMERERLKGESGTLFRTLSKSEREETIERDLERLGVAAIGMFNRQALHITRKDLDRDIEYFDLERDAAHGSGQRLTQADLLLGGFFFIHESRTVASGHVGIGEVAAFEFLHNTFGEFLGADFILRLAIRETRTINKLREDTSLRSTLQQRLGQITEQWFGCLSHTPIHTRPVIVEMLREWVLHRLNQEGRNVLDFVRDFDLILSAQLSAILNGEPPESLSSKDGQRPFGQLPLMAHAATYSLNLVVLRTVLSDVGFEFLEADFRSHDTDCRPWDRLVSLWRSWLSLETLSGLSFAVGATRTSESVVKLQRVEGANETVTGGTKVDDVFTVAKTLGDGITAGLAGLVRYDAGHARPDWDSIEHYLDSEQLGLKADVQVRRMYLDPTIVAKDHSLVDLVLNNHFGLSLTSMRVFEMIGRANLVSSTGYSRLQITASEPPDILSLGRAEASLLVATNTAVEPRWLDDIIAKLGHTVTTVRKLLRSPSAAPVLREATLRWYFGSIPDLAKQIKRASRTTKHHTRFYDSDTAAYCFTLGERLSERVLIEVALENLTDRFRSHEPLFAGLSQDAALMLFETIALSSELKEECAILTELAIAAILQRDASRSTDSFGLSSIMLRLLLAAQDHTPNWHRLLEEIRLVAPAFSSCVLTVTDICLILRLARKLSDVRILRFLFRRYSRRDGVERGDLLSVAREIATASWPVRLFSTVGDDLNWAHSRLSDLDQA